MKNKRLLTPEEVVKRLNSYIQRGVVKINDNPDSLLSWVWGATSAEFQGMKWGESKGQFLGGGLRESYGYYIEYNGQKIKRADYIASLRIFLNFIDKKLTGEFSHKMQ